MCAAKGMAVAEEHLVALGRRLLAALGPQHWWPAETDEEVVIGAVLTQAVSWQNVERAIARLKQDDLCALDRLRGVPVREVALRIRPAGYFNVKARKLHAIADFVQSRGGLGALRGRPVAINRAELLAVYGIGPETADAILCYALGQPAFVADAYARRVLGRVGLLPPEAARSYEAAGRHLADRLPVDAAWLGEFHALLVAVGKTWCRPSRPDCGGCPALAACAFGARPV